MDQIPIHMLADLPDDLQSPGWQLLPEDTDVYGFTDSAQYIAVYERHFDPDIDDLRAMSTQPEDRGSRARISINQATCTSWEDAHPHAIEMMRDGDAYIGSSSNKRRAGELPNRFANY